MSKGVLIFAFNNSQVDYVKQAYFLAKRIEKYMKLPVSVVTDASAYIESIFPDYADVFDHVIHQDADDKYNMKRYNDGSLAGKQLHFKNKARSYSFELSPYDETLIMDSDFVISNAVLLECFSQSKDFLIYKDAYDLANHRDYSEFNYISDTSVDFYWATVVFFRKTPTNKIFFDLVQHIQENWMHYNSVFQINSSVYRNDHAFSIAIHIMNGYQQGDFAGKMPGKLFYTTDKDLVLDIQDDSFLVLVEKENYLGEYTAIRFKNNNLHIMNKFSLNRIIGETISV